MGQRNTGVGLSSAYAPTTASGSQAAPLESFYGQAGTGNRTTNADLPQWLKAIGMKGDAYAGGMLKPELRYGMAYKGGKIYFADGTSYSAKKTKANGKTVYQYTDSSGKAVSYDPTDEQNAYNQAYKKSTSNQSFLDKATNAVRFELDHGKQIVKGFKPSMAVFGVDPIGVKIGNAVTGRHDKPLVDQMGGALDSRYADYEERTGRSTGLAKPLQGVAHAIAAMYGAKGLSNVGGNIAGRVGLSSGAGSKFGQLATKALDVVDRITNARDARGAGEPVANGSPGASAGGLGLNSYNVRDNGPLRRFERTPGTLLTNMRGAA